MDAVAIRQAAGVAFCASGSRRSPSPVAGEGLEAGQPFGAGPFTAVTSPSGRRYFANACCTSGAVSER